MLHLQKAFKLRCIKGTFAQTNVTSSCLVKLSEFSKQKVAPVAWTRYSITLPKTDIAPKKMVVSNRNLLFPGFYV